MSSQPQKIYIEILNKIHDIIEQDGLQAGDKLPSERELSDRLKVGRSSVREALRSLELLGLIETRRGEGTFIVDANEYRLIEILGTFILQNDKVVEDLIELKNIIEMTSLPLACLRMTDEELIDLEGITQQILEGATQENLHAFHKCIVDGSKNRLLYRVWKILYEYYKNSVKDFTTLQAHQYESLLQAMKDRDAARATDLLNKLLLEETTLVNRNIIETPGGERL
jgi:GntR family transcriptional regulator, transcriptional repressor for pyruvate dehydrogenase complex